MQNLHLTYGLILAAMCFPRDACAASAGQIHYIPDCAGTISISRTHIVRVEQNGALILADGRAVLLEGIRLGDGGLLPAGTLAALREMTGPVTFATTPPTHDRYGRLRAQGFTQDWLQTALLERGLARVTIAPDRNECAPDLYEAEARGRARRAGLWALPATRIRTPQDVKGTAGSFQLVEGVMTGVGNASGRVFLDFDIRGQRSFAAVIMPEDKRAFRDFDLDGLAGKRIRVRGIVQDYRGRPQIALSNPQQIEVVD